MFEGWKVSYVDRATRCSTCPFFFEALDAENPWLQLQRALGTAHSELAAAKCGDALEQAERKDSAEPPCPCVATTSHLQLGPLREIQRGIGSINSAGALTRCTVRSMYCSMCVVCSMYVLRAVPGRLALFRAHSLAKPIEGSVSRASERQAGSIQSMLSSDVPARKEAMEPQKMPRFTGGRPDPCHLSLVILSISPSSEDTCPAALLSDADILRISILHALPFGWPLSSSSCKILHEQTTVVFSLSWA